MIEFYNISLIKDKFANFLSKLHYSASLSLEQINHAFVYGDYFDFFEENKVNEFINKSYRDLAKEMFFVDLIYDANDVNPVYWAGLQYINISFNYLIPLRQVFLCCPLIKMVEYFNIYHEMNSIELCKAFYENDYKSTKILNRIRKDIGITVEKLSILTEIPVNTLINFERKNDNLFNASHEKISKLASFLNVKQYLLSKNLNFIPLSKSLFKDEDFLMVFSEKIKKIYKISDDFNVVFSSTYGIVNSLYIGEINCLITTKKKIIIDDDYLIKIIVSSALSFLQKHNKRNLFF